MESQRLMDQVYVPVPDHLELTERFKTCNIIEYRSRWDELWRAGDHLPWDQGSVNPVLTDLVKSILPKNQYRSPSHVPSLIPEPIDLITGRRRKALVPGCGRGYDVVLLASVGFDVVGVDISKHAVAAAESWIEEYKAFQGTNYEGGLGGAGRGSTKIICGDFFQNEWNKEDKSGFDLIYDYTFFCAMPPELRPDWALRMSQLLSQDPRAALICVEYPLLKPPSTGGPPFGLSSEMYEQHLGRPGEIINYDSDGHIISETDENGYAMRNENGLVRLAHYMPNQTHDVGRGKTWISVWRHPSIII